MSKGTATTSSFQGAAGAGLAFGLLLEIGMHIFVHYTIPGANFASGLAQILAPAMDAIGLTTVFSGASGVTALSAGLPALAALTP